MTRPIVDVIDWKKEIAVLAYVKDAIFKLDADNLWRHQLPKIAASKEQVVDAEGVIGHPLDSQYVEFLRHADGWPAFYQNVDLFGTNDLKGGERMRHAQELLSATASEVFRAYALEVNDLLPIAVSSTDLDLFVLTRPHTSAPGTVVWFAGEVVDRFPSFHEYFLAMTDYNRLDYQNLRKDRNWQ